MTVGVLHPGEMGASIGSALRERGHRVIWASAGRSADTKTRAEAADLDDVGSVEALVSMSDVVISICPPHAALATASAVASGGGPVPLYVDANAVAPRTAAAIHEVIGPGFVDGDVIGGPLRPGGGTRLYLSGPGAETVKGLFDGTDRVHVVSLGDDPTAASALKMCYAAWTKGTSALLLAIKAVARQTGVEAALEREWERSDLVDRAEAAIRVLPKAWRFVGEMDEIAQTFADVGVPGDFHRAAAEVYRRVSGAKDWGDALSALTGHVTTT